MRYAKIVADCQIAVHGDSNRSDCISVLAPKDIRLLKFAACSAEPLPDYEP
jgi:hypothetical protein